VLSGGEQALDDRAVQVVGDRHADDVDVRRLGDRLPARLGPLVPEAARGLPANCSLRSAIALSLISGRPAS
jgi:hypothetical protein